MAEPDPTIRRATPADRDAAVALWEQLQDEHEALDPRVRRSPSARDRWATDFDVWVRSDAHRVFVAEAGPSGEVVGLVTAHPYWPAPVYVEELEVYVTELVVHADWRGRGVGRMLLDAVRTWAEQTGAARVRAGVLAANAAGRRFWEREGAEDLFVTVTLEPQG